MSETRATYNVTPEPMQPGRELDALVARVMDGIPTRLMLLSNDDVTKSRVVTQPAYSTEPAAAMEAWEWLIENCNSEVWLHCSRDRSAVTLSVQPLSPLTVEGIDYKHAIALAVCEAGRALGVIL